MVNGIPSIDSDYNSVCKGCMRGKNLKKAFPHNSRRSKEILELIHSNICGPMSSPSLSGYLYYAISIDDFSHKT